MATWTEKVQEHYATCIDHWDTHMHDYMNSDFKEKFWVSYFQDQVRIMEMKETMKKRSKVKKFQVMELENALIQQNCVITYLLERTDSEFNSEEHPIASYLLPEKEWCILADEWD